MRPCHRTVFAIVLALLSACSGSTSDSTGNAGPAGAGGNLGLGGGAGAGGTTTAGATGTGGSPVGNCTGGVVTFKMTAPAGRQSSYCVGRECGGSWVTVRTPAGADVPITWPCITECSVCTPVACKMSCAVPRPIDTGVEQTWDGSLYAQSTCGAALTCVDKSCASPEKYVAKMCAYARTNADAEAGTACESDPTPVCVEVPFTYPSATVVGTIGN